MIDQGIGMDEATLARLFQRFSQGDASTSRRFGGTGLGLEISRSLARLMDGDILVRSTPGEGSVFTLNLPLTLAESAETDEVAETSAAVQYRPDDMPGLDVLVVEDQAVNRQYMQALLQRLGHDVRFAENGQLAVQACLQRAPDLVLMDLHMPVMDGLEATRVLRAQGGALGCVPIVALTADVFEETRQAALDAGMNAFVTKPVGIDAVQAALMQFYGQRGAGVPPEPEPLAPPPPAAAPASAPRRRARRRFRSGELAAHLDMGQIGEFWLALSPKSYASLTDRFFNDESSTLGDLLAALQRGDHAALRHLAHAFKGAAASLGFHVLAALALQVEKDGAEMDRAAMDQARDDLLQAWEMAHALCLGMGMTSIEQARYLPEPA